MSVLSALFWDTLAIMWSMIIHTKKMVIKNGRLRKEIGCDIVYGYVELKQTFESKKHLKRFKKSKFLQIQT